MRVGLPLAAIAAGASLSWPAAPQTPPTFHAGVDLVRIDVVVLGDDGQPVTGLTAGDFEVTEGGRMHDIVSFEPIVVRLPLERPAPEPGHGSVSEPVGPVPEENRSFLIFLDDVHLGPQAAERVRAQLIPFLEREMREGDWVTVLAPLSGLRWTARTSREHRELGRVISNLKGQFLRDPFRDRRTDRDVMTDYEAMRRVEYAGRELSAPRDRNSTYAGNIEQIAQEKYLRAKRGIRQSLGALEEAMRSLAGFRGRKALLFYSEGFIRSPSMRDYDRVIELARRAHVAIYFVYAGGLRSGLAALPTGSLEDERAPSALVELDTLGAGASYLAAATGGRASISSEVTALLREAAVESSSYYLIGFQPTVGKPGERKIKIRVRRDGVSVRATDRYLVGEPEARGKAVPAAVQALAATSDATDVPLRVATLFLDDAPRGEQKTTLAVELDRSGANGPERRLNLIVDARPADGGKPLRDTTELRVPSRGEGPAVATRDLLLRPGVWQARVIVRDVRTDKVGSVLHTFEVPEGGGLRLSSPLLTDTLESERRPRPVLKLSRRYVTGTALYCQYRVFGAAVDRATGQPRVSASWAILRSGAVVREEPATPIEPTKDGQIIRLLGFGLAGFEPGDYALVLRATDEVAGQRCERTEPFFVVSRPR